MEKENRYFLNKKVQKEGNFFSKAFCILPWIHTFIDVNGVVKLCCISIDGLNTGREKPYLNVQLQSIREIWNSPEMKTARRNMIEGKKIETCNRCYEADERGIISIRKTFNIKWLIIDKERNKFLARVQKSINNDFAVDDLPVYYDLRPGNICTLKCRMCHAHYSSLIQNDPVHSKWTGLAHEIAESRFSNGVKWYDKDSEFLGELLENINETRLLFFAGGEPFVNPFIERIIDNLIEDKVSDNIELEFSSNLTVFNHSLFSKLRKFKSVKLVISVDGLGPVYEYIRYPGKWHVFQRNLKRISEFRDFSCRIIVTVQNYNVLTITELLRFTESLDIPCTLNILYGPEYLNIGVMPKEARVLAAERLKAYADKSLIVQNDSHMKLTIDNVLLELKHDSKEIYQQKIEEFIRFTNSLDKSRNQSFKDTLPELYLLIADDGYT